MDGEAGRSIDVGAALQSAACGVMVCDGLPGEAVITFVNAAFTMITGYAADEVVGRDPRFLQGPETDQRVRAEIREAIAAQRPVCCEILNYRKNGEPFWNQICVSPIRGGAGATGGFVGICLDTTASHVAEPRVHLHRILADLPGFIYRGVLKADGRFEVDYISPSAGQYFGEGFEPTTARLVQHLHPEDVDSYVSAIRASATSLTPFKKEFRLISRSGAVRWVRSESRPVRLPNGDTVWEGVALDVTAEKASEAERSFLSLHDKLTGLANRELFRGRLRQAIEHLVPGQPGIGVFCLDLDMFQEVNDTRGEAVGDEVLKEIARRLTDFAGSCGGTVARVGGDQFALLIPMPDPNGSIAEIARAVREIIQGPMTVEGQEVVVQGSVGAAVRHPTDRPERSMASDACEEIMKQADLALHAAKQEEPGGFRLYEPRLDDRLRNRVALRQSLIQAVAEQQFELHYQPVVALDSGAIAGAEALVRWSHPTLGLQRPEAFIPLAESSGLIVPLGDWILRRALSQGRAWQSQGLPVGRVAINLSAVQLRGSLRAERRDFVASVEAALADTGADPRGFEFELTEGTLIESSEDILSVLRALKSLGFGIAIDDFGTGHASFRYLRDLVFDKVKIDRSFISRIGEEVESEAIVSAMIRLPRLLGATVVGEGVESPLQRDFLYENGCDLGQGYLFSMPLQAEDFGWMLAQGVSVPSPHAAPASRRRKSETAT